MVIPVRARTRPEWVRGEQQLLPLSARRRGVQLVHSLANTAPVWGAYVRTVTIHDLLHRIAPEAHLGMLSHGMRVLVTAAARRSARVIVDAESTRVDVRRLLGIDPRRVDVVPLGLGARRGAAAPETEIRAMLAEPARPIVLSVSALRPHKNLVRLIEAVGLIDPERRPLVVIVGYPTDHEAELHGRIAALGLRDDVRVLGWVPSKTLEGLYAISDAFVFPSLYEGFGLPVLEAMARGVPVACSGQGSLREVAGDAALTFDPRSPSEIARAIERLLAGGPDVERLRTAGHDQAARLHLGADRPRHDRLLPAEPGRRRVGRRTTAILAPVHHDELSGANPRGGDINLRSGPQMEEYRAIAERIRTDDPPSILDWGCGYGQVTSLLHDAGLEVTAFDYNPDVARGAPADGALPAPRGVPQPRAVEAALPRRRVRGGPELRRAGARRRPRRQPRGDQADPRPGGTFYVFKLPNRSSYLEAVARRAGLYYHGACEHDRLYDRRSATGLLRRHGFEVLEFRRMNMLPLSLTAEWATRSARRIWNANRLLSAVPGLNLIATNLELVARTAPA